MKTSVMNRAGRPWTQKETDLLLRAKARGMTYRDIAKYRTFGDRSVKAIRRRYERVELGLS